MLSGSGGTHGGWARWYTCWVGQAVHMLGGSGGTHAGWVRRYICWAGQAVHMLGGSGGTHVGRVRRYTCWVRQAVHMLCGADGALVPHIHSHHKQPRSTCLRPHPIHMQERAHLRPQPMQASKGTPEMKPAPPSIHTKASQVPHTCVPARHPMHACQLGTPRMHAS